MPGSMENPNTVQLIFGLGFLLRQPLQDVPDLLPICLTSRSIILSPTTETASLSFTRQ